MVRMQTRHHFFVRCEAWAPQPRKLWKSIGKACRWKHIRALWTKTLFEREKDTPAVLTFLREARVGEMVSRAALGRGRGVGASPVGEGGEGGEPAPP